MAGLPHAVYQPGGKMPKGGWPLVLFLHGAGERGADGKKQTTVGLGPVLRSQPAHWPMVVVMPQCPQGLRWADSVLDAAYQNLLDTEARLPINRSRVYLTGLSMGGNGTWNLAARLPDRFAAIAPVCGGADPFMVRFRLAQMPIWNFHSVDDAVVPVGYSRILEESLRIAGNTTHRFTELDGYGHRAWEAAYPDPELPRWLLAHQR